MLVFQEVLIIQAYLSHHIDGKCIRLAMAYPARLAALRNLFGEWLFDYG